ncbi:hypothetical protein, partial [Duncaniella sp.]
MNFIRHIRFLLLTTAILISASALAGVSSLKVSLDSAFLLMGRTTPLHIELVTDDNSDGHLVIPKDSVCDKVEILKYLTPDTTGLGSGRREIKQDLVLQSFDS